MELGAAEDISLEDHAGGDSPYKGKQSKASFRSEDRAKRHAAYDLLLRGRHKASNHKNAFTKKNYENSWNDCEKAYYNCCCFPKAKNRLRHVRSSLTCNQGQQALMSIQQGTHDVGR